jgi:DNA repair protein RadD
MLSSIKLRLYQSAAIGALEAHWQAGGGPALIEMATATGKSLVIGETTHRQHIANPGFRSLIAVHVQELVEQDVKALLAVWPEAPYGICCEGLGRRDHDAPIIIGTIQSLARDAEKLGRRDLVMIDEVQMTPRSGDGQYLSLLDTLRSHNSNLHLVGASATCFRLDSGYLHKGEGALFEKIVYSYGIAQGIEEGYLSPLRSKATSTRIDVRGVGRRGGEFIQNELERATNVAEIVEGAVNEIVEHGNNVQSYRRCWICFCVGIDHAYAVRDAVRRHNITCETVTSETPADERRAIFSAFREGSIRCLTGVNIFSVGFDIPQVDLLALLRPTLSPGLYIQQVGRSSRLAPGKTDALVLDFAGNVRRHGPVDDPEISNNPLRQIFATAGIVATITCPKCQEENSKSARVCVCCGHVFVSEVSEPRVYASRTARHANHSATADEVPILSTEALNTWIPVCDSEYRLHQKRSDPNAPSSTKPPTLRVDHTAGFSPYSEYISFESANNYARSFAHKWWNAMGGSAPAPLSVPEAILRRSELGKVIEIQVGRDGQWWRINRRRVQRTDGTLVEIDGKYRSRKITLPITSEITSEVTTPITSEVTSEVTTPITSEVTLPSSQIEPSQIEPSQIEPPQTEVVVT